MNENVTNKTPNRRRWVARLLVSALCILLASSLLFVGVVADTITLTAQFNGTYSLASLPEGSFVYPLDASHFVYRTDYMLYINSGSETLSTFDLRSSSGYDSSYSYAANRTKFFFDGKDLYCFGFYSSGSTHYISLFIVSLDEFRFVSSSAINFSRNDSLNMGNYGRSLSFTVSDGVVYGFLFSKSSTSSTATVKVNPFYLKISSQLLYLFTSFTTNNSASSTEKYDVFYNNGWIVSSLGLARFNVSSSSNVAGTRGESYNFFEYEGDFYAANLDSLKKWDADTLSFETVGNGVEGTSFYAENGVLTAFKTTSSYTVPYTVYSGLPTTESPPESSDETTEEPPPESSEDSSDEPAGSVIDVYKVSPGSDPSFVQSLDLGEVTSATVFLGSYFITDDAWSDISQYCYIQFYSDSGPLDRITFDFYATGFSYDNVSWVYPKIIGTNFDIDISNLETLYLSTLSPFGTVTVQNENSVLRQFNFQSSTAYVEIENTSAEEALWYVYGSDTDSSPATFTTVGMQKYIIRRQSGSATIPVLIDYGDSGIVSAGLVYNGAPFPVGGIIITDDPYLIPPIDTGSWDNVLSQAQSGQELEQSIADKLNSYIDDAFNTVSFDGDISDSFVNGVGVLGDILDTSGGSVIVNFFANMWTIHPYSLAMVGLVSTFLIFSFILRKS